MSEFNLFIALKDRNLRSLRKCLMEKDEFGPGICFQRNKLNLLTGTTSTMPLVGG